MRIRATILVLLFLGTATAAPDWATSLTEAKRRARASRKPILCVILKAGQRESARLERELSKNRKLVPLAERFECVKLGRARAATLVQRYGLKYSPSTIFFTPGGSPMRTVVGPVNVNRYANEMTAALRKYEEVLSPKRPTRPKNEPKDVPTDSGPALRHSGYCPRDCEHCGPARNRALAWLARSQQADGRWTKPRDEIVTAGEDGRVLTRSIDHVDVALTAVSGMAFLAAGARPGVGKYGRVVRRADTFTIASVRPDGIICNKKGNDYVYLVHANFETALGAMFLAEMEKIAPDAKRRDALARVRDYLTRTQDPVTGAWGYGPGFREHSPQTRRGYRLLATTHCALTALNHISAAGLEVDEKVRNRAVRYLLACRGRNGAFTYRAEFRMLDGYPGATAGALFALTRSGLVGDAVLEPIWKAYRREYREFDRYQPLTTSIGKHWWFFLLFTSLTMHDRGAGAYDDFAQRFRDVLIHAQEGNGSFAEADGNGGRVFATAVAAFVLSLDMNALPIATAPRAAETIDAVAKPRYLKPPHPESRVKVFPHGDGYLADLIVSVDGPADRAYFEALEKGVVGASRIIFDVTDGQMQLHRVVLVGNRKRWDEADIRITKDFYDADKNPRPWAHGITRVSKRTDLVGGKERERKRIGDWIMFPYHGRGTEDVIRWDNSRYVHVLAHELCHYLFGLKDEYHATAGESFCDCIMGKRRVTELCTEAGHTDDRQDAACWTLAKGLYPNLVIPDDPDPGPWKAKRPIVVVAE